MTDNEIIDDELSRLLRFAYIGARSELSMDHDSDTYQVFRAECLIRSFVFGSDEQYQRQCAKHGAKLTMREKH